MGRYFKMKNIQLLQKKKNIFFSLFTYTNIEIELHKRKLSYE